MNRKILFPILGLLMLFSCTIEQEYYFNKDYSGEASYMIDYSGVMAMMSDSALSEGSDIGFTDQQLDSLQDVFYEVQGLHDFEAFMDSTRFEISFRFDRLEVLQDVKQNMGDETGQAIDFERKGKKKFLIDLSPLLSITKGDQDSEESDGSEDGDELMNSIFDISIKVGFEREIKSLKSKLGVLDEENNAVLFNFGLDELDEDEENMVSTVIFK